MLVCRFAASTTADLSQRSQYPQTVPDMSQLLASDNEATPADKYKILADAGDWTVNDSYPGYFNAAVGEIFEKRLIIRMFAAVVTGKKRKFILIVWQLSLTLL
jgi:hypothetical protein